MVNSIDREQKYVEVNSEFGPFTVCSLTKIELN